MTGPAGKSESVCFPQTLNVSRGEAERNIEVEGRASRKFTLLFLLGVSEFWPTTRDAFSSNQKTYLSWEV